MCCEIGTDRDARSVQDGARSVQDGATRSVRCGATRLVRCGATISVQMVRDPCEMVRDWCQMLRDRYEILRQWHEMVRDSTRCCKISTSLRDGVRSVRGGAALRSVRDGAFHTRNTYLPKLLSRGSPGGPPHVLAVPLCAVLPGHKARAPAFHLQMMH